MDKKDAKQKSGKTSKEGIIPGEIKGKINVSDTRERRDGPGGN